MNRLNIKTGDSIKGYKILKLLGQGGFGAVFKVQKGNQIFALKIQLFKNSQNEIKNLKIVSQPQCNPNVACYIEDWISGDYSFIVSEFIEGMEFDKFVMAAKPKRNQIIKLMYDITVALEYIHDKKLVHADIKPENILVKRNGTPVIVDLGVGCSVIAPQKSCKPGGFTKNYASPEFLTGRSGASFKFDVYSLGMTFYNIFLKNKQYLNPSDSVVQVISKMASLDPNERISLQQVRFSLNPQSFYILYVTVTDMRTGSRFSTSKIMTTSKVQVFQRAISDIQELFFLNKIPMLIGLCPQEHSPPDFQLSKLKGIKKYIEKWRNKFEPAVKILN